MSHDIKNIQKEGISALILSLTLGLAPFYPEPHILGKIRWIWGGAEGMQWMDWFDVALHGLPWVYLLYVIIKALHIKLS
jgi:hypothetical protein